MYTDDVRRDPVSTTVRSLSPHDEPLASAARYQRTSEVLSEFARSRTGDRVSIGEIAESLGDRGLGVVIAIFALPNVLPSTIPFGNVLTGIPVILFAGQLLLGMERLTLPDFLARRSISTDLLKTWTPRVTKLLAWFEALLRPRMARVTSPEWEQAIGALCMALSIVSTLPIPFGHQLPALGIMLIGLGLIERDGLALLVGSLIGLTGIALLCLALFGLAHGVHQLLHMHAAAHLTRWW
jgi:hypothetical protein